METGFCGSRREVLSINGLSHRTHNISMFGRLSQYIPRWIKRCSSVCIYVCTYNTYVRTYVPQLQVGSAPGPMHPVFTNTASSHRSSQAGGFFAICIWVRGVKQRTLSIFGGSTNYYRYIPVPGISVVGECLQDRLVGKALCRSEYVMNH